MANETIGNFTEEAIDEPVEYTIEDITEDIIDGNIVDIYENATGNFTEDTTESTTFFEMQVNDTVTLNCPYGWKPDSNESFCFWVSFFLSSFFYFFINIYLFFTCVFILKFQIRLT